MGAGGAVGPIPADDGEVPATGAFLDLLPVIQRGGLLVVIIGVPDRDVSLMMLHAY